MKSTRWNALRCAALLSPFVLSFGAVLLPATVAHAQLQTEVVQTKKGAIAILSSDFKVSTSLVASFIQSGIFTTKEDMDEGIVVSVQGALVRGGMRVVDRSQLEKLEKEKNLAYTGVVDPNQAASIARAVGAKTALMLTVGAEVKDKSLGFEKEAKVRIDYRMIDVETSEIVGYGTVEGKKTVTLGEAIVATKGGDWMSSPIGKALENASKNLVKDMQESSDPSKRTYNVLSFDDKQSSLIIDGGEQKGVKSGDEFEVVREKDVDGFKEQVVVARAIVAAVQDERSKLNVTLNGGDKPKKGDKVRPVKK